MKNIVLIGMMGCGKTTVGRILSRRLGRTLVDTDARIEEAAGKSIPQIFQEDGEAQFRAMETRAARELGAQSDLIVATGGGLPLREENVRALRENGIIFWLKRDPGESFDRGNMAGRPLAQGGRADFLARFQQRAPLYAAAADHVIEEFSSPEKTAAAVFSFLQQERKEG